MAYGVLERTANLTLKSDPVASMIRRLVDDGTLPKDSDPVNPQALVDSLTLSLGLSGDDGVSDIDRIYIAKKTVDVSGFTLRLTGQSTFVDPFGDQIDFQRVFYVMIDNAGTPESPNIGVQAQDTTMGGVVILNGLGELGSAYVNRGCRMEVIRKDPESAMDVSSTKNGITFTRLGSVDEEITILIVGSTQASS